MALDTSCPFCGGDGLEPGHAQRCGGQDRREARVPLAVYRPRENVRTSDPDTSHAAAESLDVTEIQQRVYDIHRGHDGLTDEELLHLYLQRYGVTAESTPRKRRCDITKTGLVRDSGVRRPLKSGRNGIVWRVATEAERERWVPEQDATDDCHVE